MSKPVLLAAVLPLAALLLASPALAACGDANALGVSRVLTVDTGAGLDLGRIQYKQSLPLADHEFVLTFDDGPLPGRTEKVLAALDDACVKATFFIVGRMARAAPELLRRLDADGQVIATHSLTHPLDLQALPAEKAAANMDEGYRTVEAALGHPPAPFVRFPGLGRTRALEAHIAGEHLGVFSADVVGDDWTGIGPNQIRQRVLARLERQGSGIILLHDIKRATDKMLPELLADLKAAGFKLVEIVPTEADVKLADAAVASAPLMIAAAKPARGSVLVAGAAEAMAATPAIVAAVTPSPVKSMVRPMVRVRVADSMPRVARVRTVCSTGQGSILTAIADHCFSRPSTVKLALSTHRRVAPGG